MSDFPGGPGRPFGDEYDGLRAATGIDAHVRQRVQKQVTELTQRRTDDRRRRGLAGTIQTRWADTRQMRIDLVTTTEGPDSLVVGGEILLRRASWEDRQVQAYLRGRGLQPGALGCDALESRLVRLVADESMTSRQLDDIVAELRDRGHAASLTHVTPLQPVVKPCSSVAASAIETFSDYPVSSGDSAGVKVAVIDTGIEGPLRTDGWLAGIPRTVDDPSTAANDPTSTRWTSIRWTACSTSRPATARSSAASWRRSRPEPTSRSTARSRRPAPGRRSTSPAPSSTPCVTVRRSSTCRWARRRCPTSPRWRSPPRSR